MGPCAPRVEVTAQAYFGLLRNVYDGGPQLYSLKGRRTDAAYYPSS